MAKEATLQVRMDAELKEKAEALYRELGITSQYPLLFCHEFCCHRRGIISVQSFLNFFLSFRSFKPQ